MRALLLAALLILPAAARAAIFDQGPPDPRDFRNPTLALDRELILGRLYGALTLADFSRAQARLKLGAEF